MDTTIYEFFKLREELDMEDDILKQAALLLGKQEVNMMDKTSKDIIILSRL